MKSWVKAFLLLAALQMINPAHAQHILQGQLFDSSIVDFELVDGFAFQNSILIRLNGEPYGHFNGTVGMRAKKLHSLIAELNLAKQNGGHFYLPTGSKRQRGAPLIQSIVHFPAKAQETSNTTLSKQCAPLLEEHQVRVNQVFKKLKKEMIQEETQARSPASLAD